MVSKKILGVAIAAAMLSQGAFAFTSATAAQKVSAQTLVEAGKVVKTSGATGTYYTVAAGANIDTTMTGTLGTGFAIDQKVYVRVELTNAVFATARVIADFTLQDYTAGNVAANVMTADTLSQGGSAGAIAAVDDNYVVYSVTPTVGNKFNIASAFSMTLGNLLAKGTADVGVKVTAYDQLASAIAGSPVLSTSNNASALTFVSNGVTITPVANDSVIDVSELFKKFVVGGGASTVAIANIGSLTAGVTASVASATSGANLAAYTEAAAATSAVKISGDFSVGTWGYADNAACTVNLTALTGSINTAKTEINTTLGTVTGKFLCVTQNTTTQIPVSNYSAVVTYAKIAGAATAIDAQAASAAQTLGKFTRNGTTLNVPYITINPQYKQRFVIANSSTADAILTVGTITPEDGSVGTDLIGSTGVTLPAGKTTVVQMSNLISLDNSKTRARASFNVSAPSSKVDATTTTVNTSDSSTDTVIIQKN